MYTTHTRPGNNVNNLRDPFPDHGPPPVPAPGELYDRERVRRQNGTAARFIPHPVPCSRTICAVVVIVVVVLPGRRVRRAAPARRPAVRYYYNITLYHIVLYCIIIIIIIIAAQYGCEHWHYVVVTRFRRGGSLCLLFTPSPPPAKIMEKIEHRTPPR